MNRKTQKLLALPVLCFLGLTAAASAQSEPLDVHYDFADGSRAGWYTSRASSELNATSAGGGSMTQNIGTTTTQLTTYFATPGNSVAVGIGETLQVSMNFSFAGMAATGNQQFRIGLFNSKGSQINTDDKTTVTSEFNGYDGYGFFGSRGGGWVSAQERTGNSNALLVDSPPWTALSTLDNSEHPYSFAGNLDYTLVFSIDHIAENEVMLRLSFSDGTNTYNYSIADTTASVTSFDTLAISFANGLATSVTFTDVSIQVVPTVPEPATAALIAAGAAVALLAVRRRHARSAR